MIRDVSGVLPTHHRPSLPAPSATPPPARPAEPAQPAPPRPGIPALSPRMRIDTSLNLVVLEFRDAAGEVDRTIPSPRQLDAYRIAGAEAARDPPAPDRPALDVTR